MASLPFDGQGLSTAQAIIAREEDLPILERAGEIDAMVGLIRGRRQTVPRRVVDIAELARSMHQRPLSGVVSEHSETSAQLGDFGSHRRQR